MTHFKSPWRQAAADYRTQAYPGDLAADVRPSGHRASLRYSIALIAAALVVACLIVFIDNDDAAKRSPTAPATAQRDDTPVPRITLPSLSGHMPSVRLPHVAATQLPTRLNLPSMRSMSLRSPMKRKPNKENAS